MAKSGANEKLARSVGTRRSKRLAVLGLLCVPMLMLLMAGCATRTVGMQAPLAHDYDGIQWRPLDATIAQKIIVAPGYTALVENDPATDPDTLHERIRALPDDVRSATLIEIRVALRPARDYSFDRSLTLTTSVTGSDETIATTTSTIDDMKFENDWALISSFPPAFAGDVIEIHVGPAQGWEYGITVSRMPYGGYGATAMSGGAEPKALGGALGFQTVFDQSTDRSRLLEEAVGPSIRAAFSDPFLVVVYAIMLLFGGWILWIRHRELKAS